MVCLNKFKRIGKSCHCTLLANLRLHAFPIDYAAGVVDRLILSEQTIVSPVIDKPSISTTDPCHTESPLMSHKAQWWVLIYSPSILTPSGELKYPYGFSCHCYTDDTQHNLSFPPSDAHVSASISACLARMATHHLKLNHRWNYCTLDL